MLVTDAFAQSVAAIILLFASAVLQLRFRPFSSSLFNFLEAGSIASAFITAVLSTLLLRSASTDVYFSTKPASLMTPLEWALTSIMGIISIGTIATLACAWFYFVWSESKERALPITRVLSLRFIQLSKKLAPASDAPTVMVTSPLPRRPSVAPARVPRVSIAPSPSAAAVIATIRHSPKLAAISSPSRRSPSLSPHLSDVAATRSAARLSPAFGAVHNPLASGVIVPPPLALSQPAVPLRTARPSVLAVAPGGRSPAARAHALRASISVPASHQFAPVFARSSSKLAGAAGGSTARLVTPR